MPQCGPACRTRDSDDTRRFWGCDEDSADYTYAIRCTRCHGYGGARVRRTWHDCRRCAGAGTIEFRRCPHAIAPEWAKDVCTLATWAEAHGVLPVAGGTHDQSSWLWEALQVVLAEKAKHEREAEENRDLDGE